MEIPRLLPEDFDIVKNPIFERQLEKIKNTPEHKARETRKTRVLEQLLP